MGEKWYPAKNPITVGDKVFPAVIKHTKDGKETGEPRMASSHRQPLNGPKVHGGHCCYCHAELELYSADSKLGFCEACGKAKGDLP